MVGGTAGGVRVCGCPCHATACLPQRASLSATLLNPPPPAFPASFPPRQPILPRPHPTRPHPTPQVGEFGLDRAAVVPGSRLQPGWDHQLALTEAHLALAAELRRPVSMHCVQGYGHLQVRPGGEQGWSAGVCGRGSGRYVPGPNEEVPSLSGSPPRRLGVEDWAGRGIGGGGCNYQPQNQNQQKRAKHRQRRLLGGRRRGKPDRDRSRRRTRDLSTEGFQAFHGEGGGFAGARLEGGAWACEATADSVVVRWGLGPVRPHTRPHAATRPQDMLRRLGPEGCPPKIMLHRWAVEGVEGRRGGGGGGGRCAGRGWSGCRRAAVDGRRRAVGDRCLTVLRVLQRNSCMPLCCS